MSLVQEGSDLSIADMIKQTRRGLVVTFFWYIRGVPAEDQPLLSTGMTRDGTFLIENGRVRRGLRNFRFNQGIIELLNNVEALSPSVRASGEEAFDMVVPAMKVRGFNFTEVTRF